MQRYTRRRFLGLATTAAGGILLPHAIGLTAKADPNASEVLSTKDFFYRRGPAGMFVDSQCDNKAFAYAKEGKIFFSEDCGATWPYSITFPDAQWIRFSVIFKNGNILFATREKLYLSTDKLKSYEEITVKDRDGSDYKPHTPKAPAYPGWYFHTITGVSTWEVNGQEMLVWGNYCNVIEGATPVHVYYSTDQGKTVKIAYSFGQNSAYCDNGKHGGSNTGTRLGNPDNPIITRHVHDVEYNPAEDAFYVSTGDHNNRPEGLECHWLRGKYDSKNDTWQWKLLKSTISNTRYKSTGINCVDGKLYWASDANGPEPYDRGIFCCDPADFLTPEKHKMLYKPIVELGGMIIQDNVILASHCAPASPMQTGFFISLDEGKTWATHDLKEFGKRSPTRFHRMNRDGWFRADLRSGWVTPCEMIFIKPKNV